MEVTRLVVVILLKVLDVGIATLRKQMDHIHMIHLDIIILIK